MSRPAYDYVGSLPVAGYRADVPLVPHGTGTRITWHSEFRARYPLTGPLLRALVTRVLRDVATRLARAAEGAPRP